MNIPKISIIVPVYKVEKYLRRCLDSIVNQTFTNWECILVDDGSPDNSGKICDEYSEKDKRFRVFHQENAGVSAARNNGLDEAKGEWICLVDSDDWVEKEMLVELYNVAICNKAEVVVSGFTLTDGIKKYAKFIPRSGWLDMPKDFEWYMQGPCAKLFSSTILHKYNIRFPEGITMAEDLYFTFQVYFNSKKIFGIKGLFYVYYQREESAVHNHSNSHKESSILVRRMMQKKISGIKSTDWNNWLYMNIIKLKTQLFLENEKIDCNFWRNNFPETNSYAIQNYNFPKNILFSLIVNKNDRIVIFLVKLYKVLKKLMRKFK